MKAIVARLSICKCGHPTFMPNVKIGDVYEISGSILPGTMTCGGCQAKVPVNLAHAAEKGSAQSGLLPLNPFNLLCRICGTFGSIDQITEKGCEVCNPQTTVAE